MALPDDGDLNLDLTLAPPMVDDQAAPPVGEEPQQGPVVADLFPEVEELNAIINGLTSEEVQQAPIPIRSIAIWDIFSPTRQQIF